MFKKQKDLLVQLPTLCRTITAVFNVRWRNSGFLTYSLQKPRLFARSLHIVARGEREAVTSNHITR